MPQQETHFTEKDRATLTVLEVKMDRAIQDIANLTNGFATKAEVMNLQKQVDDLSSNQRWVVRSIIGIVVAGFMAIIINSK